MIASSFLQKAHPISIMMGNHCLYHFAILGRVGPESSNQCALSPLSRSQACQFQFHGFANRSQCDVLSQLECVNCTVALTLVAQTCLPPSWYQVVTNIPFDPCQNLEEIACFCHLVKFPLGIVQIAFVDHYLEDYFPS
jgi:hypothetical protein